MRARFAPKRQYSIQILLPFERDMTDGITMKQVRTFKGMNVHRQIVEKTEQRQNPYIVNYLKDRYQVFINAYNNRAGRSLSLVEYENAVYKWYYDNHFVDKSGNVSSWAALRHYEEEWKMKNPNDEFGTPVYLGNKKSHHGTGQYQIQHEKEMKKKWRQSEAGKKSTQKSRDKAKQNKYKGGY